MHTRSIDGPLSGRLMTAHAQLDIEPFVIGRSRLNVALRVVTKQTIFASLQRMRNLRRRVTALGGRFFPARRLMTRVALGAKMLGRRLMTRRAILRRLLRPLVAATARRAGMFPL